MRAFSSSSVAPLALSTSIAFHQPLLLGPPTMVGDGPKGKDRDRYRPPTNFPFAVARILALPGVGHVPGQLYCEPLSLPR
jgi:hypothetical protein